MIVGLKLRNIKGYTTKMDSIRFHTLDDLPELVKDVPENIQGEVGILMEKMVQHEAYGQP